MTTNKINNIDNTSEKIRPKDRPTDTCHRPLNKNYQMLTKLKLQEIPG